MAAQQYVLSRSGVSIGGGQAQIGLPDDQIARAGKRPFFCAKVACDVD
jgi:hypothetical protein